MNPSTTLAVIGAVPVPEGFCYSCGYSPGDPFYSPRLYELDHQAPGVCWGRDVHPADPARLIDRAVLAVVQDELQLGHLRRDDPAPVFLPVVMADRVRAVIEATLSVYSQRGAA